MSFNIKTSDTSAFAARGLQDRNARHRHLMPRSGFGSLQHATWEDSLSFSGQASAEIRQERDCQALVNDALSFLQTQDEALGQIEDLLKENLNFPETGDFRQIFESLTGEKFNGLDLFSHDNGQPPLPVWAPLGRETLSIQRPLMDALAPVDRLRQALVEARQENHKEQLKLRELSKSSSETGGISNPDMAKETASLSRQYVLRDAATALSSQANSAHAAVLKLFV
ncbi:MAG: hypothetical protein WCG66_06920 [bacterium]